METKLTREHLDAHIDRRLRMRVRLYLGISILIIAAIIYRVAVHGGGVLYPLIALVVGICVGSLLARMYLVSWDKNAAKVVSRIDTYGVVLLVVYVIFEISGEHLIGKWFSGPEILTLVLALAGGAVLGRGIGIGRKMVQVLRTSL